MTRTFAASDARKRCNKMENAWIWWKMKSTQRNSKNNLIKFMWPGDTVYYVFVIQPNVQFFVCTFSIKFIFEYFERTNWAVFLYLIYSRWLFFRHEPNHSIQSTSWNEITQLLSLSSAARTEYTELNHKVCTQINSTKNKINFVYMILPVGVWNPPARARLLPFTSTKQDPAETYE